MKVRDAMSASATTLRPDTPLQAASPILIAHGQCAAAVVDHGGRLVGVVSEADLTRARSLPNGWMVEIDPECVVGAVMTHRPVSAGPDDDLADVVATMLDSGLRAVPIVDADAVVGILTPRDVLRLVADRRCRRNKAGRIASGRSANDRI